MTPLDYYQTQCKDGLWQADSQQLVVLNFLQQIYLQLEKQAKKKFRLLGKFKKVTPVRGLYIWGSVGVGKTMLMDSFYQCLSFKEKKRFHFYKFMAFVHAALTKYQGKSDPLRLIASDIASSTKVLCFDELFVSDITDAMILGRLFEYLFRRGVCLVATSNVKPDDLYRNGLQREQFLPAIMWIKKFTQVVHVLSEKDYRYHYLTQTGVFYLVNDRATEKMSQLFSVLNGLLVVHESSLEVNERLIKTIKWTEKCAWFEFETLCAVPRSQRDYLVLSQQFETIMLSNVPVMKEDDNRICFFIQLIDVLYDAQTKFIFSAMAPISELYTAGSMRFEYARTASRLAEMQSADYGRNI